MRWGAVIAAAGSGTRFGRPKQLLPIAGAPMVAWSIEAFATMDECDAIVVVTERRYLDEMRDVAAAIAGHKLAGVIEGGASRQASVANGIEALAARCDAVAIHDGARPLIQPDDIRAVLARVAPRRGAVLAAPVVDTIKVVDASSGLVRSTLDRSTLWAAQTPQAGMVADFRDALWAARDHQLDLTDDVALLEWRGCEVVIVPATAENFKVTYPPDRERAEAILTARAAQLVLERNAL